MVGGELDEGDLQIGLEFILTGVCGEATPLAETRLMGGLQRSGDLSGRRTAMGGGDVSPRSSSWRHA